jgi:hypothetical protein
LRNISTDYIDNNIIAMSILLSKLHDGINFLRYGADNTVLKSSFRELVDRNMLEKEVPMSDYKGNVLLVTNVASK